MSKYIKLEDAIERKNQLYHSYEVEEWLKSLPTIEVSEENIKWKFSTIADDNAEMGMRTQIEPVVEVSEDAISREWAIKQQREMIDLLASHKTVEGREHVYWQIGERELVAKELMDAPSVVPTTEQSSMVGEWIISEPIESGFGTIFECSYCGEVDFQPTNYCHNCGARMKGADDE